MLLASSTVNYERNGKILIKPPAARWQAPTVCYDNRFIEKSLLYYVGVKAFLMKCR